ncbi:hypothetical protein BDR03DRAFT_1044137 [Suillus americanus]|nr:hypothetical protein BDR03DRAFT_1044137 [Suillus americanus]
MTAIEHQALEALRDPPTFSLNIDEDLEDFNFGDILDGTDTLPISNAGGEFGDLARGVLGEVWRLVQRVDNRTRRDHVLRRNVAFNEQIQVMSEAYIIWSLEKSQKGFKNFFDRLHSEETDEVIDFNGGQWPVTVIDAFFAEKVILKISSTDHTIASALVRQGVMPCSPISPATGITSEALELCISPHLLIQAFIKTMCDLHGVQFHRHLSCQFLIALDLYLQIRRVVASLLPTGQLLVSDCYLSRDFVDQFARDSLHTTGDNSPADNSCKGRWKNMDDAKTKKAWGIYDETGIFVAVCRHGFCLLITDMVQSGELAKYPLAIVAKLLDAFGGGLGGGYDIGCQFRTTLDNSSLGPLVHSLCHTCLGLGIEDLETCERTFSKSNALASALWYTSVFHHQQAIDSYFEHNDEFEAYSNISNFLHGNYKQALEILENGKFVLPKVMQDLGIKDESVFECWLEDEKAYLKDLTQEPEEETIQITILYHTVQILQTHAKPRPHVRNLRSVQALECKLEVITQWVPEDGEWQRVGRLVANRKYQRALDRLEGLVVAHIFELAKMNRAGTGEALQTCSASIRSTLGTYNKLASAVYPPRQILKWEEVVEYAFLADFDLLRNMHSDVSQLPWSSPAARSAMDLYFKMCRAREEICRLNVEVCRLVTYIHDEDKYLRVCEDQLTVVNPALAHQIAIHRNVCGRFNSRHLRRLHDISKLPGFTGTLVPGLSACMGLGESASMPDPRIPDNMLATHIPAHNLSSTVGADTQEDLDEEEVAEEVAEEALRNLQDILLITDDFSQLQIHDNGEVEEQSSLPIMLSQSHRSAAEVRFG